MVNEYCSGSKFKTALVNMVRSSSLLPFLGMLCYLYNKPWPLLQAPTYWKTSILQGCCFSRPRGPNSPYPGAAAQNGSSRAINSPGHAIQPLPPPALDYPADGHQHQHPQRSRRRRRPLDQHINKPLRRKEWASKNRTWSRSALDRERQEFFDTRVTGRPEVWQNLRAALAVLWESDIAAHLLAIHELPPSSDGDGEELDSDEHDPAMALATAQSILDAGDITLPTGNLADGAYDALGNYYQLPAHIVSDPVNIVPDDDAAGGGAIVGETKDGLREAEDTAEDADFDDDDDDDDAERRREEKGKGVADVRSQVVAVIRMSDTGRDMKLHVGKEESVRSIIRRINEETGVSLMTGPASSVLAVLALPPPPFPNLESCRELIVALRAPSLSSAVRIAASTRSASPSSERSCRRTPRRWPRAGSPARS